MFSSDVDIEVILRDFHIEGRTLRYSSFMGRLFNLCLKLGFEEGKILPSRAFCSDESQGYPIILIAKHFGTFPFNHGRVGGVISTDRHGPFAQHGKDLVIIHASHVGYDPDNHLFGTYRRLQTENNEFGPSCGKISGVLSWYRQEYEFARKNILLERSDSKNLVIIDNYLLRQERNEGIFLNMDKITSSMNNGSHVPVRSFSTAKCFVASEPFRESLKDAWPENGRRPIGALLNADVFKFKRHVPDDPESGGHLEQNLLSPMACIITSSAPLLVAAQVNTQVEFDRTCRTLATDQEFHGKRVLFISGLNIDISPSPGQLFPLTKFVPWAACLRAPDGTFTIMEQEEIFHALMEQSEVNDRQVDLEEAIHIMADASEVKVRLPDHRADSRSERECEFIAKMPQDDHNRYLE